MPNPFYTADIMRPIAGHAIAAAIERTRGEISIALGTGVAKQVLDLRERGMCAKFVRQVHETACGFRPFSWAYAAPNAQVMCRQLAAANHAIPARRSADLLPGDIIGVGNSAPPGHVCLYVGEVGGVATVAENTSSGTRGNPRSPGTKLTPYADIAPRVDGVYRLRWMTAEEPAAPDVSDWAEIAVAEAIRDGLMSVGADGLFHGQQPVTREMLAEVVRRLRKLPE